LIIVVDDAPGCEETRRVVAACNGGGPSVRYVEGNGGGLADAHNRGLTDDDIVADKNWLARIVGAFASAPNVGCVTGKIVPLELETQAQVWLDGYAAFDKGAEQRLFDLAENR